MSPVEARLAAVKMAIERDFQELLRQLHRAQAVDPARGELEAAFVALALDHALPLM